MEEHGVCKVVPPVDVVRETLKADMEENIRTALTLEILFNAGLEDKVTAASDQLVLPDDDEIQTQLPAYLDEHPVDHWTDWVSRTAKDIAA
ncbi:hypothetical protein DEM27_31155 [Metarhizobium album]|uniref:Uncharacterized protein n=1 Tax=Metarhizobium album TaxID=2182425 RepID=A0A2U2DGG0_9HYPH|nr:hypothetical protein [Rhizobium album]PWE52406.1 hypothetical protein DEM27_31155 [Rhizobium album]